MASAYKRYAVTVTRHWYDREKNRPCSREYEEKSHVMARSEREAAERVRRRYKGLCGGPSNVTYTCRAEEA